MRLFFDCGDSKSILLVFGIERQAQKVYNEPEDPVLGNADNAGSSDNDWKQDVVRIPADDGIDSV